MFVERTFEVHRPLAEVWDFLSDFTSTEQWDPGTTSTVRTTGDGGLGTVYRNRSEFMGRSVELRYETVTFKPDDGSGSAQVQFRGQNGATSATDSMTFTAVGEGATRVHYRADFLFSPALRWIVPLFIRRRLDTLADDTVARIRTCLA